MEDGVIVEELEVLESIYLDELIVQRDDSGHPTQISMQIHPATGDDVDKKFVCITLVIDIPQKYPDDLPEITLKNPRGLGEEEVISVKSAMLDLAEERKGGHMLYDMIEIVVDSLTQGNVPRCACTICCEYFTDSDSFTRTACYHFFHVSCLDRYVRHELERRESEREEAPAHTKHEVPDSDKVPCPVCREEITLDKDQLQRSLSVDEEETIPYIPTPEIRQWQRQMSELREKQKHKGGIIDMEEEKNKFLVTEDTVFVPISVSPVPKDKEKEGEKKPKGGRGRGQARDREYNRNEDRRTYDRGKHNRYNDRDGKDRSLSDHGRKYDDRDSKERGYGDHGRKYDDRDGKDRGYSDHGRKYDRDGKDRGYSDHGRKYDRDGKERGYNNHSRRYDDRKKEKNGHNDNRPNSGREDYDRPRSGRGHYDRAHHGDERSHGRRDYRDGREGDRRQKRQDGYNDRQSESRNDTDGHRDNQARQKQDKEDYKTEDNNKNNMLGDLEKEGNSQTKVKDIEDDEVKNGVLDRCLNEKSDVNVDKTDSVIESESRDTAKGDFKDKTEDNGSCRRDFNKSNDETAADKKYSENGSSDMYDSTKVKTERKTEFYNARERHGFGRPKYDNERKYSGSDRRDYKDRGYRYGYKSSYNSKREERQHDSHRVGNTDGERQKSERRTGGFGRPKSGGKHTDDRERKDDDHDRHEKVEVRKGDSNEYVGDSRRSNNGYGRDKRYGDQRYGEQNYGRRNDDQRSKHRGGFGRPNQGHDSPREEGDRQKEGDTRQKESDRSKESERQKEGDMRKEGVKQEGGDIFKGEDSHKDVNWRPRKENDTSKDKQGYDRPRKGFGKPKLNTKSDSENKQQCDDVRDSTSASNFNFKKTSDPKYDKSTSSFNGIVCPSSKELTKERIDFKDNSVERDCRNDIQARRTPPGFKVKGLPPGLCVSTEKNVRPPPGFEDNR